MHVLSKHTRKDPELISSKSKSISLFVISLQRVTHLSGFRRWLQQQWEWEEKYAKKHKNSQLLGCSVDVLMELGRGGNASEIPWEIPWDKALICIYAWMDCWWVDVGMGWTDLDTGSGMQWWLHWRYSYRAFKSIKILTIEIYAWMRIVDGLSRCVALACLGPSSPGHLLCGGGDTFYTHVYSNIV